MWREGGQGTVCQGGSQVKSVSGRGESLGTVKMFRTRLQILFLAHQNYRDFTLLN